MLLEDLYKRYKSARNIGTQLGFAANTPLYWKRIGHIPIAAQLRIERLTNGLFKASIQDIPAEPSWPHYVVSVKRES